MEGEEGEERKKRNQVGWRTFDKQFKSLQTLLVLLS
jgi:hypothetical protein